jgi:hypothetical protein
MPLIFWATQTKAAMSLLGVGEIGSIFTPYIGPTSAASSIQHAYCLYLIWQTCCLLPKVTAALEAQDKRWAAIV